MIHSVLKPKTLRTGLCVAALCLASLPLGAAQLSTNCSGVKKAVNKTRQADYSGAVALLTEGEWRSRDEAMQCFYRRVSKMKKITAEDYWGLGDAFLAAYREQGDSPETALASTYLDGAEVAYRRGRSLMASMPGSGFVEVLVEQAERKELPALRREVDVLLAQLDEGQVEAPAMTPWRSQVEAWRELRAASGTEIHSLTQNRAIEKPVKVTAGPPNYPLRARFARVQDAIVVQTIIDERGRVQDAVVLKGGAMGLSEEAVRTIKTWRFEPAKLDGQPVPVYYNLTMNFRLQ